MQRPEAKSKFTIQQVKALLTMGIQPNAFDTWKANPVVLESDPKVTNEILIYGAIVPDEEAKIYEEWFGIESLVSGKKFKDQMDAIQGDVVIRINSPGGDVHEASTIIQAIDERGDNVNCIVDGIAASAASMIMAACGEVTLARLCNIMIHNAASFVWGDHLELRKIADVLESVSKTGAKLYNERMQLGEEEIMELMATETWFTADEALEVKLGDKVSKSKQGSGDDDDKPDMSAILNHRKGIYDMATLSMIHGG